VSAPAPPPPPGAQWSPYQPQPSYAPSPYAPPPARSPEKPTGATVLSIIGGVFILLGGLAELAVGSYVSSLSFGIAGGGLLLFGALGVILGMLVLIFGILLSTQPENHSTYGVLILVFAVISLTSFGGGFFIGFLLALIGGILAITWKPTPPPPAYYPPTAPMARVCPRCGRVVDPSVRFCPQCGSPVP